MRQVYPADKSQAFAGILSFLMHSKTRRILYLRVSAKANDLEAYFFNKANWMEKQVKTTCDHGRRLSAEHVLEKIIITIIYPRDHK